MVLLFSSLLQKVCCVCTVSYWASIKLKILSIIGNVLSSHAGYGLKLGLIIAKFSTYLPSPSAHHRHSPSINSIQGHWSKWKYLTNKMKLCWFMNLVFSIICSNGKRDKDFHLLYFYLWQKNEKNKKWAQNVSLI